MTVPRALAVPAALAVVLTVVGAWIDGSRSSSARPTATTVTTVTTVGAAPTTVPAPASASADPAPASTGAPASTATPATEAVAPVTSAAMPARTSCEAVVHIGDSTSVGLISSAFLSDPAQRIDAQYARIGVTDFRDEIKGARSIVERYKGEENADQVATRQRSSGYHGCWVLALGTTDSANIGAGASLSAAARIDRMMAIIGNDPVLWVNVKTLVRSGAWSEPHMAAWDEALTAAAARYPNLEVYDWAAVVEDAWFQRDGIHYTSEGYAQRARLIADALATADPA
jgi:hypothetical protein